MVNAERRVVKERQKKEGRSDYDGVKLETYKHFLPYHYEEGMEKVPEAVDKNKGEVFRRKPKDGEADEKKQGGRRRDLRKNKILAKEMGCYLLNAALDRKAMERHTMAKDTNKELRHELMKEWPAANKLKKIGDMAERERKTLASDLCAGKIEDNVVKVNAMLNKVQDIEKLIGPKTNKRIMQEELMAQAKVILPQLREDNRELKEIVGRCILKFVEAIVGAEDAS